MRTIKQSSPDATSLPREEVATVADDVLVTTLLLAVPMWVERLYGCIPEQRQAEVDLSGES
ncbi:hypothetical protein [Amycolatopsis sp. 195334CR]|uniref:hypothetical protein n=1 Tax=Amycolatopsis sp. 195334CR TaxID=2814588 RepID=UPI001A9057EB|nr:hypothetical protein [Amycolatopsis sp. 195334CR]MBN6037463.1 hypothetical protein [Amycolatopsis sp. 195334CR]